jgi:hypothetical protein
VSTTVYCLSCKVNTMLDPAPGTDVPRVIIPNPMKTIKVGVPQFIVFDGELEPSRHYPNVDLLECPGCSYRVVR